MKIRENKDCKRRIFYEGLPNSISKGESGRSKRNAYIGYNGSVKTKTVWKEKFDISKFLDKKIYSDVNLDDYSSKLRLKVELNPKVIFIKNRELFGLVWNDF